MTKAGKDRKSEKAAKAAPVGKSLLQVAFPQQATIVFLSALIVGLGLVCLPTIFRSYFVVNGTQSNLVLCSGLAIVLAAFGGQATVRIGSIVMAGAAGIAIGLFWYLEQVTHRTFLEGNLTSYDYEKFKNIEIKNRNQILGATVINQQNLPRSNYEFMIVKNRIEDRRLEIKLTTRADKEVVLFVDVGEIEWAFGNKERLEWQFKDQEIGGETRLGLYDTLRKKFVSDEKVAATEEFQRVASKPLSLLLSPANAQEGPKSDVQLLLTRLQSDDATLRYGARDALAKALIEDVPMILNEYRVNFDNYRTKLGVGVSLSKMLQENAAKAGVLSEKLTKKDIELLLSAAGDEDRTVRIYATDFLTKLGDERATKLAISMAANTKDPNAKYNWLLTAQGGWKKLSDSDRKASSEALQQAYFNADDRTKEILTKLK